MDRREIVAVVVGFKMAKGLMAHLDQIAVGEELEHLITDGDITDYEISRCEKEAADWMGAISTHRRRS